MKKVAVGSKEVVVESLIPFIRDGGAGEKVLVIKVSGESASFATLQEMFSGASDPIDYYEDDVLICSYAGYDKFEATFRDGIYTVDMRKSSLERQLNALASICERITGELSGVKVSLSAQKETFEALRNQMEALEGKVMSDE